MLILCRGLTHLIQAPKRSSSTHFTEEESKAQRDPVVWQPREPACPPSKLRSPTPSTPAGFERSRRKIPSQKTVGSCQDELWLMNSDAYQVGMVRAALPKRPCKDLSTSSRLPVPSTTKSVGHLKAASQRHMYTSAHSWQTLRTSCETSPLKAGLNRSRKSPPDMTATPTKITSS